MKAAGTTSISVALRSFTVACLGLVRRVCNDRIVISPNACWWHPAACGLALCKLNATSLCTQVLMFRTSAVLTGLTLAVLPLMLLAFQVLDSRRQLRFSLLSRQWMSESTVAHHTPDEHWTNRNVCLPCRSMRGSIGATLPTA